MRLVIDSLIALMLASILAGILLYHRSQNQRLDRLQSVHRALARLHEQANYHGAIGNVDLHKSGFPADVSAGWFNGDVPINLVLPGAHPWLDVAPTDDDADNPPDPIITTSEQAGFWYNPARGIFRARVSPQFTDDETLSLYNELNGTALKSLPRSNDAGRKPVPAGSITAMKANELPNPNFTSDDPSTRPSEPVKPKIHFTPGMSLRDH